MEENVEIHTKLHVASRETQNTRNARNLMVSHHKLSKIPPKSPKTPFGPQAHFFAPRRLWREKCALARKGDFWVLLRTFPDRGLKTLILAMY